MSDEVVSPQRNTPLAKIRSLRVWPAVLLIACLWGLRIIPGLFSDMSMPVMMASFMGPLVCAGLILLWWLFLSRALVKEKALGSIGLVVILAITTVLADKTIQGFGMVIYGVPLGMTGFAVALIVLARLQSTNRTWLALSVALVCFGYWSLVRIDEVRGDFETSHTCAWKPTAEDQFLQDLATRPREQTDIGAMSPGSLADPEWPAFRGADRNGVQENIVLGEDWQAQPPREIWRVRIGPGWSSFSVAGNRLFTQKQRGEDEAVVCYDTNSGTEVWAHQYKSRFWEAVGGAGPRGTPTLSNGNLFALGALGMLHRLDPTTGELVWCRDIREDAGRDPPQWGYASSPLVTDGVVIVYGGGSGDKGLLAYDVETGDLRWGSPAGDHSYSSPQLASICGRSCVLMLTNKGITFADQADGTLLFKHVWDYEGYRIVQPLVVDDTGVLLGTGMKTGTRRIELSLDGERFTAQQSWTSPGINPNYNDYVAHRGYLYGFDNNIFACVDLATGERKWKKGRYGNGQVLLLPEGDQLLVISEDGELVLLRATPEKLDELAKHRVLDGRTWNHPVLVGNRLYVRNGEEAACFEVPTRSSTEKQGSAI